MQVTEHIVKFQLTFSKVTTDFITKILNVLYMFLPTFSQPKKGEYGEIA